MPKTKKPARGKAKSRVKSKSGAKKKSNVLRFPKKRMTKKRALKRVAVKKKSRRGGARPGAGRPKGQGPYGEATKPIRIPLSKIDKVLAYVRKTDGDHLPLYSCAVAAGSPAFADDHREGSLDLNEYLINSPGTSFFVRVSGDSMLGAGIHDGDILVVDRSLPHRPGKIVIAALAGELTVKRLSHTEGRVMLMPENDDFAPILVDDESDLKIWGVVTGVVHKM